MAYKFQLGPSVLSGTLEQEGSIDIVDDGSGTFELKVGGTTVVDSTRTVTVGNLLKMPDNTSGKFLVADGTSYQEVAMSGDATLASGGAVTIGNLKIKGPMLNANVISGLTGSFTGDIDDNDEFLISHTNVGQKKVDFSVVRDAVFADVSGDATVAAGGALTIAADAVEDSMLNDNVISGQTELAHADIVDADELMISDGGVLKKVGVDSLRDHFFGVVSGDATVADGGALTIANSAVEASMLNANVLSGASGLDLTSDGLQLSASLAGAGLIFSNGGKDRTVLAVDIDGLAAGTTLHQTDDHFMYSDNGTEKKITFSDLQDSVFADVQGDATIAAGGSLTIAAGAVEHGMLNDNIISGQDELAHADIADADDMMISDNGTIKKVGVDSLRDHFFGVVSGDATIADGGALTIAANAVEDSMVNDNVATGLAGAGLSASGGVMAVDLSELTAESIASGDFLPFEDVTDNGSHKITIDNLATFLAGAGLSASGGVLSTEAGSVQIYGDENKTLLEGMNAGSTTLTADRTLTLPASPDEGDVVHVKAPASLGGNDLIVQKGSAAHRIDGQESILIESDAGAVSCMFIGSNTWVIF